MEDFPVCPSSERTMSVLPPFRLWLVKIGRFYRKVVSANLFPDTLPKSKDCTAQSLSRFATAPFTQGSPWRVPHQVANHCPNNPTNSQFISLLTKPDNRDSLIPGCLFPPSGIYSARRRTGGCSGSSTATAWQWPRRTPSRKYWNSWKSLSHI